MIEHKELYPVGDSGLYELLFGQCYVIQPSQANAKLRCFQLKIARLMRATMSANTNVGLRGRMLIVKKAGMLLAILLLTFIGIVGQESGPIELNPGAWKQLSPPASGFTISMPGTPLIEQKLIDTKLGKIDNYLFSVQTPTAVYLVAYADFPEVVTDPATIKRMLDSGRDQALAAAGAKLRNEKDIKLLEYLGREWAVEVPGNYIATARAFWVKRRLYQTIIVRTHADNQSAETVRLREDAAIRFLDSFALSEEATAR